MKIALEILRIPTAPRHEEGVAEFVRGWLKSLSIPFREDRRGNIIAELRQHGARAAITLNVHMDHPGFEATKVSGRRVEAFFLGGVPQSYFRKGVAVDFFAGTGKRVASARVIRVLKWEHHNKSILLRLVSGSTQKGDFGMWRLPALRFNRRSGRVISRACDDLAGCAAVLATLAELARSKKRARVYAIFTRREEIGLEGAFEVARSGRLPKSVPVVSIETSKALSNAPQGAGPIVRVGDRSSIFDPGLTQRLCSIAKNLRTKNGQPFPFQRKLMDGGTCEATAYLEAGYAASGLCVALGNYHNCAPSGRIAAENIHLEDWRGLVKLMVAVSMNPPK